jgi:hypothetical protein
MSKNSRSPVEPTDPLMKLVANALYQYSCDEEDDNDAMISWMYYHTVCSQDMTLKKIFKKNYLSGLVNIALKNYKPSNATEKIFLDILCDVIG